MHGCVGDLAIHDTTLAEEPFLRELETVKARLRHEVDVAHSRA